MVLGTAFVYSATMVNGSSSVAAWYSQSWFRQIVWYALGTGLAVGVCCVDYHTCPAGRSSLIGPRYCC